MNCTLHIKRFSLYSDASACLPEPSQEVSVSPSIPQASTCGPGATQLVYVVENDRISSVITELIVKKNLFGGQVRSFPNGQLAFDHLVAALQAGAAVPDLILLDLDMPQMDGWEFLDALAGQPRAAGVRVFLLTSSINADDRAKAAGHPGVHGFFTKPLDRGGVERMQELLRD